MSVVPLGELMQESLFGFLVLSLGDAALVALGLVPDPEKKTQTVNVETAKQHIDMLSMLQEKTKGNLTVEETRLIDELLYDLRLKFVDASRRPS